MDKDEERLRNKTRKEEYREYNQILQMLDQQDQRDLATHLLLVHKYKKERGTSKPTNEQENLVLHRNWTAWPLPVHLVHRPTPIYSSSSERLESLSSTLHAEIEAIILRLVRQRIQSQDRSTVSAHEHPPFGVTKQITDQVVSKLNCLLHALGRVKYQHVKSDRVKRLALKSRWDEVVGIAGISGCIYNTETMKRVTKRCSKLFGEKIPWEADIQ